MKSSFSQYIITQNCLNCINDKNYPNDDNINFLFDSISNESFNLFFI